MNSNAFVSFGLVLLVIAYSLVYNFDPDREGNMARFVSDDAVVYVEQRDIESAVRAFKYSRLGKNIDAINFKTVGSEIGIPEKAIKIVEMVQKKYDFFLGNRLYDELLGNRFAIAFFDVPKNVDPDKLGEKIFKNSIIILEPRHNAQILKTLAEHYSNYSENLSFQTIQYGNHHISRITTNEGVFSLSVIDGLIVASFNEKRLKRSIDTYDKEIESLADDVHFNEAFSQFKKPQRFIYLPVVTLNRTVDHALKVLDPELSEIISGQLEKVHGFTGVSYGAWILDDVVRDKLVVSYEDTAIDNNIRQYLNRLPGEDSMLELTTTDPLAYYWSNSIDLSHLLEYVESEDATASPVHRYIEKIEQLSGKKIDEIVAMLGNEVSLVVEKGGADNFFPVPLGVLVFRLGPEVDPAELANNIVSAFGVPVIEQLHDSVTYLYWVASPQDGLQPLCGYWSNFLFVGNSAALLERIVDSYNNNQPLMANKKIKKIDPGVSLSNNSIAYFNNLEIIHLAERLLGAISTMVSLEDKEKAEKARTVISKILLPLLDGLKEYERSFTRSYFAKGMVVIESSTAVRRKQN